MDAILGLGFLFLLILVFTVNDILDGPEWDHDWLRGRKRGRTSDQMKNGKT